MEKKQTTFKSLSVLKSTQESVKSQLGEKYEQLITPYIQIIEMIMQARSITEFEALKIIKDELPIYKKVDAPLFFSAALIEITEGKHFGKFVDDVKNPMTEINKILQYIIDNDFIIINFNYNRKTNTLNTHLTKEDIEHSYYVDIDEASFSEFESRLQFVINRWENS